MSLLVLEMRDKEVYSHIRTKVDNNHNSKDVQSPDDTITKNTVVWQDSCFSSFKTDRFTSNKHWGA